MRCKKGIALLLILLIVLSGPLSVFGEETNKEKLDNIREELEAIAEQIRNYEGDIDGLMTLIAEIDAKIDEYQAEIDKKTQEIEETKKRLANAELELVEAEDNRIAHKETADKRMRVMYMYGNMSYLEVLFSAGSITDFFSRLDAVRLLTQADDEIFSELLRIEAEIQAKKDEIEEEKAALEAYIEEQQANVDAQVALREEKEAKLEELESSLAGAQEAQNKLEQDEADILRILIAEQNADVDFGNTKGFYLWPTPGYYYITSEYGYRVHPVYGYTIYHDGLDIGASYGTPILSPGTGVVLIASYYGGYGYTVLIDMGGGVSMLLGHCSQLLVSKGDVVTRGQAVALVGSTGVSTGPHLHLEVRLSDGSTDDPMDWVYYPY